MTTYHCHDWSQIFVSLAIRCWLVIVWILHSLTHSSSISENLSTMENESYLDSEDYLFHHDHLDSRQKLPFTSTRTKANNTPSCIIAPLYITLYMMLSSFRFDDVTFVRTSAGSGTWASRATAQDPRARGAHNIISSIKNLSDKTIRVKKNVNQRCSY